MARWIPGFVWIQFCLTPRWSRPARWWAVRDVVPTYACGPLRVMTLRNTSDTSPE